MSSRAVCTAGEPKPVCFDINIDLVVCARNRVCRGFHWQDRSSVFDDRDRLVSSAVSISDLRSKTDKPVRPLARQRVLNADGTHDLATLLAVQDWLGVAHEPQTLPAWAPTSFDGIRDASRAYQLLLTAAAERDGSTTRGQSTWTRSFVAQTSWFSFLPKSCRLAIGAVICNSAVPETKQRGRNHRSSPAYRIALPGLPIPRCGWTRTLNGFCVIRSALRRLSRLSVSPDFSRPTRTAYSTGDLFRSGLWLSPKWVNKCFDGTWDHRSPFLLSVKTVVNDIWNHPKNS